MNKNILACLIFLLLTACVSALPKLSNQVTENKSTFDGSTEITMEPGFVYAGEGTFSGGSFKLGLHWSSTTENTVWILAEIPQTIISITSNEGLLFNVDGNIIKFSSDETFTSFDSSYSNGSSFKKSQKSFRSDINFVQNLMKAQSVKVKLISSEGYLEGDFKADKPGAAIRGFKDFIVKVNMASDRV